MQHIYRTKRVEGAAVPGIIQNGGSYFYIQADVYEDGMVNCWELVDLRGLQAKLRSGWLTPTMPEGEAISIFGLGSYRIQSASWRYDQDSYYQLIQATVQQLNPELSNVYTISEAEVKLKEQRRVASSPSSVHFQVVQEHFYQTVEGKGFYIFMKRPEEISLCNLVVYKNGTVSVYGSGFEEHCTLEEALNFFDEGTLFTEITEPTEIAIPELGRVILSDMLYGSEPDEKKKQMLDSYAKLQGEKTAHELCREAYYNYLEYPTDYNRTRLKERYEQVPVHERMYLGDMDSKDLDYQRIIYYPEQKREV